MVSDSADMAAPVLDLTNVESYLTESVWLSLACGVVIAFAFGFKTGITR